MRGRWVLAWTCAAWVSACMPLAGTGVAPERAASASPPAPASRGALGWDALGWSERIGLERALAETDPRHAPTSQDGRPELASRGVTASFGEAAELRVGEHTATLRAVSIGRGGARTELAAVTPTVEGPEVRAERAPGIVEWWRSLASGLEHGVTIAERPAGEGELTLALSVDGLGVRSAGDDAVALTDASGAVVATYAHLAVLAADGARVPARMEARGAGIVIEVDDRGARYPLVIDPLLLVTEEATLLATGAAASDLFGYSVALSADGSRALVGAPEDDTMAGMDAGSARVFLRTGTAWAEEATLPAAGLAAGDRFGTAVSLSADGGLALVGAPNDDVATSADVGTARVFVRSPTGWMQEAVLAGGRGGDFFGSAVALSGDGRRALVGIPGDEEDMADSGAASVFLRVGTTWPLETTFRPGVAGDGVGAAVALDMDGSRALVGAPFDDTVATDGGTVRVFVRAGTTWSEEDALVLAGALANDRFGWSVSLSGDGSRALVGAPFDDTPAGSDAGSAHVFTRAGSVWSPGAMPLGAGSAASDFFGWSVSLSVDGSRALVGAYQSDPPAAIDGGHAFLFQRSGASWRQEATLTASGAAASDRLGVAVSLDGVGSRALVGVYLDDTGALSNAGSARVYAIRAADPNGAPCSDASTCTSDQCVDGVCCDSPCGGGVADCQACSAAAGGGTDGTCTFFDATVECRARADDCNPAERCTGTSGACPADGLSPAGTVCRPAMTTGCDVAEVCNGTLPGCPGDGFAGAGTVCGTGMGDCALPAVCDGASPICPSTGARPAGTVCRASAGPCDAEDRCDGVSRMCPDGFAPATQTCGGAPSGACDAQDHCSGTSADCVAEFVAGIECRASSGGCDQAEFCTGGEASCPPDDVEPAGMTCRASTDTCDPAEVCDGVAASCPADENACSPSDGGADDGGRADGGGTDAGGPPAPTSGCACRVRPRAPSSWSALGLAFLVLALGASRRR